MDPSGLMADAQFGWEAVRNGFWGAGYTGGTGWGTDSRPGWNTVNDRFSGDVRQIVRWNWTQYTDADGEEHTRGWWEKPWSTRPAQSPALETSGVYICSRPTNIVGWFSFANRFTRHYWIKTPTKEAGLGGVEGNVPGQDAPPDSPYLSSTRINSHAGQSTQPGASCDLVPDANPEIANQLLEEGRAMGSFTLTNNCYVFVETVIARATRSHEKYRKEFLNKPWRK